MPPPQPITLSIDSGDVYRAPDPLAADRGDPERILRQLGEPVRHGRCPGLAQQQPDRGPAGGTLHHGLLQRTAPVLVLPVRPQPVRLLLRRRAVLLSAVQTSPTSVRLGSLTLTYSTLPAGGGTSGGAGPAGLTVGSAREVRSLNHPRGSWPRPASASAGPTSVHSRGLAA